MPRASNRADRSGHRRRVRRAGESCSIRGRQQQARRGDACKELSTLAATPQTALPAVTFGSAHARKILGSGARQARRAMTKKSFPSTHFLNREIGLLAFNRRVL